MIPELKEVPAGQEIETLQRAVERCADTLAGTAFVDHDRAGWLSWELTADGQPSTMRGGNPALYDSDSGNAYACAVLGVVLDRSDLVDLSVRAARHALNRSSGLGPALLGGRPGVELAVRRIEVLTGAQVADIDASGLITTIASSSPRLTTTPATAFFRLFTPASVALVCHR